MVEKKKLAGKTILISVIVALSAIISVLGLAIYTHWHPIDWTTKEKSAEFELYIDDVLTSNTTAISFGDVLIGASANKTLRVVNMGSVPIRLTMTVTSLPDHHTLIWADDTKRLGVGAQTTGLLVLTVEEDATAGAQSCTIEIKATEEG